MLPEILRGLMLVCTAFGESPTWLGRSVLRPAGRAAQGRRMYTLSWCGGRVGVRQHQAGDLVSLRDQLRDDGRTRDATGGHGPNRRLVCSPQTPGCFSSKG